MSDKPVRELVDEVVRERLGREPLTKAEAAAERRRIYREEPGVLDAVILEERRERKSAGRSS